MDNYINMNDSFGYKHSVSSTKSFQTYEQSISTLKQQLFNHQKALQTAQNIIEQYQQENQRLINEINNISQAKLRIEQKYQVLQNLFIKLDKAKQKQLSKETRRSQEKHQLQIQNLNAKYQHNIASLNQRIFFLEFEIQKYQEKDKKYQFLLSNNQKKQMTQQKINQNDPFISKFSITKRQEAQKSEDSLQKVYMKKSTKITSSPHIQIKKKTTNSHQQYKMTSNPPTQLGQSLKQSHIIIGRASLGRQEQTSQSRNSYNKDNVSLFERKPMKHSQVRVNTTEDYFTQKLHMIKTTQKPKHLVIYDNNFTDYKDYRGLY